MICVSMSTIAQDQNFILINRNGVVIRHVYITQHDSITWREGIILTDVFIDGEGTDVSFHLSLAVIQDAANNYNKIIKYNLNTGR